MKRAADPSSHAAGSLAWAEHLPTFIEIDLKNAFNSACRQAAFDALSGVATKDYVGADVTYSSALGGTACGANMRPAGTWTFQSAAARLTVKALQVSSSSCCPDAVRVDGRLVSVDGLHNKWHMQCLASCHDTETFQMRVQERERERERENIGLY